ncbi:1709_t:CDS:2 [Acaulospora colombiana]|uniref:1709_t:CDS:1 n=1 Tax=Acaulospora colombiana TaxID=27376 RepID=A0ACA9K687_9GLOM|nr:1709_t:CDS:2 [Acaulospora colombiana]
MNLWPKIISFLAFPEVSLRKHALWVCGTAVQNNPQAQKAFTEKGGLKIIMDILRDSNEDEEVRSKALYAISDHSILRKTVFLLNTLIIQDLSTASTQIKEKHINKQMIKLLNLYWADDEDLVDKILRTLLGEFQQSVSFNEDEINELKNILPTIKKKYGDNVLNLTEWTELESRIQ